MSKQGHPLPASEEARHDEIPEHLEREKGRGDDSKALVQPQNEAVNPDGEPYRYDENQQSHQIKHDNSTRRADDEVQSRGEHSDEAQGNGRDADFEGDSSEFASDQAQHQDRGQGVAEGELDKS